MSTFKDQVAADIRGVFINTEEFAEEHDIDGVKLQVVVDYDLINERPQLFAEGTYQNKVVFFVSEEELGYRPVEGQMMVFDGTHCTVFHVASDMGMLAVTLEGNLA